MIRWHMHHIVPKHAGGTDDKSNLLKCNIAMHAFLHEQLYKEHGRQEDRFAANLLRGGKGGYDWTGKTHSEETKEKMRAKAKGWDKRLNAQRRCIMPSLINSVREDGYSIARTAEILGCSLSSVKRAKHLKGGNNE